MSRNYANVAHEVSHVLNEIKHLTADEVEALYGIRVSKDGSVLDITYNMVFGSVGEWAEFSVEQDNVEFSEHFHGGDELI